MAASTLCSKSPRDPGMVSSYFLCLFDYYEWLELIEDIAVTSDG